MREHRLGPDRDDEQLYRNLVESCPDVIMQFDNDLLCTYASPAAERMFGRAPGELFGSVMGDQLTPEDRTSLAAAAARTREGRDRSEAIFRTTRQTGELLWVEARFNLLSDDAGLVAVLRDVSTRKTAELALRVANAELNKLAGSDALTDLANRRRFDQALNNECRRASRHNTCVSLILIDIDRFKSFNDRHGHQAGDACLIRVATAARAALTQPSDMAARFAGDEFAVMLPGRDNEAAALMAETIRKAVQDFGIPHKGSAEGGVVTVSIGCATVIPTRDNLETVGALLIAETDRALYDAKRLGRNGVMTTKTRAAWSPLIGDERRLALVAGYRQAGLFIPSSGLNRIARMATVLLGMPIAFVALLDCSDVEVVGQHGLEEVPDGISHLFCSQVIGGRSPLVVPDAALDPRFRDEGRQHGFGFIAAAPLLAGEDLQHVGALWVADRHARPALDEPKRVLLAHLAGLAVEDLEARRRRQADERSSRVSEHVLGQDA
ncbi:diguanylate cyclase domain-containing protein [Lichenifustis flavocetrariae]|nr:diguanylate cyclase [Lichenifustis flavocetrariae]